MSAAVLVFTCTNATSAGSTHGAGIGSITIKGTAKEAVKTDPTITFNNGSVKVGKTLDLSTLFSSNSDGAVTYSITSGDSYASLSGSTLTGTAEGNVTVKAEQTATSTYNAGEASATITVEAALALSSIAITTPPTKTTYTEGETFDATGMVVTATYSDASTDDVTASCTFSPTTTTALTTSDTEITVSYTENGVTKTATQSITVNAIPKHNVTWNVNGTTTVVECNEGATITFPANPSDINDFTFVGWASDPIDGTTNTAPTFVSSATMGNADVTYYAVFAEESGSAPIFARYEKVTSEQTDWSGIYLLGATYTGGNTESNKGTFVYSAPASSGKYGERVALIPGTTECSDYELTIAKSTNGYTIYHANSNKYFAYDSSGNELNFAGSVESKKQEWTITGVAVIKNANSTTRILQYNGSSPRFTCYTSGQTSTDLYKRIDTEITTYSNYCTTVNTLPKPVITLSAESIEMVWGDTDKVLTASATLGEDSFEGTIVLTPSSNDLTIDAQGNIRCDVPGTYTITASIVATENYQAASDVVCTVTVNKKNVTLSFPQNEYNADVNSAFTAPTLTNESGVAVVYSSTNASVATADAGTGVVTLVGAGTTTIKATFEGDSQYNAAEASYVLNVKQDAVIVVQDETIAYGQTFTVDTDLIEGGDVTLTSSNSSVASVDGLTITAEAVGTATITVTTAEDDTYNTASETFTVTVTAPEGSDEAYVAESEVELVFTTNSWGLPTSDTTKETSYSNGEYTVKVYAPNSYKWYNNGYLLLGKTNAYITLPAFDKPVTQIDVTGTSGASESVKQNIFVTVDDEDVAVSTETTGAKNVTNKYAIASDYQAAGTVYKLKVTSNHNTQITKIVVHFAASPMPIYVTLSSTGYASYCSEYPLDFSGNDKSVYRAWYVSNVSDTEVTFTEITGSIKSNTPFILYGTPNATCTLTSAASTNELTGNLLEGTLAPTWIDGNYAYGLSAGSFVKISSGVIPAHKAYLPISTAGNSRLSIKFADDPTGITDTSREATGDNRYYDLQGRRVDNPVKGMYVVNGKKVFIKK